MTDDEIRIVIAEACGWQKCTVRENGDLIGIPPDHTKYVHIGGSNDWAFVPNYTGDLNAMHEAESRLNALDNLLDPKDGEETEWDRYVYNLEQVILKNFTRRTRIRWNNSRHRPPTMRGFYQNRLP